MKKTILIIEDSADVRENTAELLELAGYEIYTANDGKEGLEAVGVHKPDLVLCDIMMPVLDGYGVLKAFENIPDMKGVPFVFMTAKAEKADFRKGMDLGADDYLTKPFSGDELIRIISSRLKKSEILKKTYESNIEGVNEFMHVVKSDLGVNIFPENNNRKKLRKDDLLFMEGDYPNYLYFIISGKIKFYNANEDGKEYIIDIFKEGDFLGYIALLENTKHKEYAMAIENTEVALIPREDFFALLNSNHEVTLKFIKLLSKNYAEAEENLLHMAYNSARKRVADAIIYLSKKFKQEGQNEISFKMMRENISSLSGISQESVSRNLREFKDEGLIKISGGILKIINLNDLKKVRN